MAYDLISSAENGNGLSPANRIGVLVYLPLQVRDAIRQLRDQLPPLFACVAEEINLVAPARGLIERELPVFLSSHLPLTPPSERTSCIAWIPSSRAASALYSECMLERLRTWARNLKNDVVALWLAARDPRVPWYAKVLAGMVAAYALSPIDLIPDFVPVLGYADDLLIVPLGIFLAIQLIPPELLEEHRRTARALAERPVSRAAAIIIAFLWVLALAVAGWIAFNFMF